MEDDEGLPRLEDAYTVQAHDLQFGEQIGKGSFGSVYRGTFFGTEVAIKCIKKSLIEEQGLEKFIRRELFVSRFSHPSIVQFIGVCDRPDLGELLIITEFVPGGDLRGVLKDKKIDLPWLVRTKMAYDIACAMAYLHSKRILHRDLKSKNLLISYNWRIKICDFGLARQYSGGARPMTICGTDEWMAPEVLTGHPYGDKADVFSYGIVLFELVTRQKVKGVVTRDPKSGFKLDINDFKKYLPSDTPRSFIKLAVECCQNDATLRPSFSAILKKLEPIFHDCEQIYLNSLQQTQQPQQPQQPQQSQPQHTEQRQGSQVSPNYQPPPVSSQSSGSSSSSQNKAQKVGINNQKSPPSSTVKKSGSLNFSKSVKTVDFDKLKTLKFQNPSDFEEAMTKLFNSTTFTGWLVVGYKEFDTLYFQKSGTGTVDELVSNLAEDQIQYALIRILLPVTNDPIKNQKTRDIFIHWLGPKIPITQRGRKTSHIGQVQGLLKPYHSELTAISKANFTLSVVISRSEPLSGSHVID